MKSRRAAIATANPLTDLERRLVVRGFASLIARRIRASRVDLGRSTPERPGKKLRKAG